VASVILGQACKTANSANSKTADRHNSNEAAPTATATTPDPECDPNYSPCVPIATDVDCAGGRGNGPAYVKGPVRVIGKDIYRLDGDHNGIGCE